MSDPSRPNIPNQDRSFSRWLRARRQARDFTQEGLAERAECSVQMVRKLEAGTVRPSPALAVRLTACLAPPPVPGPPARGLPFAAWLRAQRQTLDLTQAALARQAGCSLSTIKRLEQGQLRPSRVLAATLARQLAIPPPDWPAWLQAARALPTAAESVRPPRRTNLPALFLPLIGRDRELAQIQAAFTHEARRLVTLTGPAGIGKTRLALYAAAALDAAFPDGVWWVPLATLTDPALLAATISRALGLHEGAGPPGVALLRPYLRHRQLLLVLDNWEHLGPAEPVLADLLAGAPGLGLLVTSQVPLRLAGARTLPLPALALPPRHPLPPLAELQDYPAIALFLQGAHVAGAAWQLAPENAGLIAAICTRLEGVPLALELAAARSRLCPPAAILAGLDAPLDFLTEESAERPARHQAVRHALAWSYALLHHADQVLFAGLGVFAGGAPLAAVATLGPPLLAAAGLPPRGAREAIQRGLERLLAHHLLARAEVPPAAPRFTLLATVRAYAREQLQALDLLSLAEHHHAAYYLALAEQLAGAGTGTPDGLDRLEGELENCHAALGWSLTDNQDRATAGRLALALGGFWETRGYWQEGRHWLGRVLAEAAALPDALVAQLRYWAGRLAYLQGDYPAAAPLLQASLAAGQAQADGPLAARALTALGWMAYCQEDYRRARDLYEQGLAGCRASDPRAAASVLNSLGAIALLLGDRAAEPLLQESLALREAAGDRQGVARSLDALGLAAQSRADYAQAGQYLRDSLALARTLGDKLGMSLVLNNLGWVCVATGDLAAAQLYLAEALGLAREVGSRWSTTLALCYLGWVAVQQGTPAAAAALLDESLALTEAQGMPQAGVLCHLGLAQVALATAEPRQAARQLAAAAALRQRLGTTLTPYERQMVARLEQAIGPP